MSGQRDTNGYAHLLRVRIGANGPTGRLMRCEKKDRTGHYWKVKLDTGEWVWPADLHVDGNGPLVSTCRECRLPFLGNGIEGFCYRCDEELFGTQQRASEPPDRTAAQRRWDRDRHRV